MATVEAVVGAHEALWVRVGHQMKTWGKHIVGAVVKVGAVAYSGVSWLWRNKAVKWVAGMGVSMFKWVARLVTGRGILIAAPILALIFAPKLLAITLFVLLILGVIAVGGVWYLVSKLRNSMSEEDHEELKEVLEPLVDQFLEGEEEVEEEVEEIEALLPEWEAEVNANGTSKSKGKHKGKHKGKKSKAKKVKVKVDVDEIEEEHMPFLTELEAAPDLTIEEEASHLAKHSANGQHHLLTVDDDAPPTGEETLQDRYEFLKEKMDESFDETDVLRYCEYVARLNLIAIRMGTAGKIPADATPSVVHRNTKHMISDGKPPIAEGFEWDPARMWWATKNEDSRLKKVTKLKAELQPA